MRERLRRSGRRSTGSSRRKRRASSTSISAAGSRAGLETKAVGSSTDAIGGYAVPEEIDQVIDETLMAISPIRAIANVVKVGSAGYRKLITTGGTPSGWVAYEAARPETNTPTFTEIVPASGELYANPAASQQMLDDAMFDVEKWLAHEIATEFARAEGVAFVKRHRHQPAAGLPQLAQCGDGGRRAADGDAAVRSDRGRRRLPGEQSGGQADRPRPGAALALPAGRGVRDELGDRRGDPQVQDRGRRVHVAAGPGGRAARRPCSAIR